MTDYIPITFRDDEGREWTLRAEQSEHEPGGCLIRDVTPDDLDRAGYVPEAERNAAFVGMQDKADRLEVSAAEAWRKYREEKADRGAAEAIERHFAGRFAMGSTYESVLADVARELEALRQA